jgi:hypothetical protein
MSHTHNTTIEEIQVVVYFDYSKGGGQLFEDGVPLTPPDPEELTINSIHVEGHLNGPDITEIIDTRYYNQIRDEILELCNQPPDERCDPEFDDHDDFPY